MISLRDGRCRGCREWFPAGTPIFYHPDEGAWHWSCWEDQEQPASVVALADQLGYRKEPEEIDEQWSF